jgi:hypothetical protein
MSTPTERNLHCPCSPFDLCGEMANAPLPRGRAGPLLNGRLARTPIAGAYVKA